MAAVAARCAGIDAAVLVLLLLLLPVVAARFF